MLSVCVSVRVCKWRRWEWGWRTACAVATVMIMGDRVSMLLEGRKEGRQEENREDEKQASP